MFDNVVLFLGSVVNLLLEIIYKIFRSLVVAFLVVMVIAIAFAMFIFALIQ